MSQIATALTRIFDRHRIVFWYDAKRELLAEFDALDRIATMQGHYV